MFSQTLPSAARKGAAIVGVVGALTLAGCAAGGTDTSADTSANTPTDSSTPADSSTNSGSGGDTTATGTYTDGQYTASGTYVTPEGGTEEVTVSLTLTGGVISDLSVTGEPQAPETAQYQGAFIQNIAGEVDGKSIDELAVDKVAGSSLTSGGFNKAIDEIKTQAAA